MAERYSCLNFADKSNGYVDHLDSLKLSEKSFIVASLNLG